MEEENLFETHVPDEMNRIPVYRVHVTPRQGNGRVTVQAAHQLGITGLIQAATGQHYQLEGALSAADLRRLADELLASPVIQLTANWG